MIDAQASAPAATRVAREADASGVGSLLPKVLPHFVFVAILLGAWELISGTLMNPFWISKPSLITRAFAEWFSTPAFWGHLGMTMTEVGLGFLLGAIGGVVVGFILTEMRRGGEFLDPYMAALYGVPKTALAPLFILWFGIGLGSKIMMAGIMVFFIVFFNTMAGLKAVELELINMARVVGASRYEILTKIKFPYAFPYVMTGIKVGLPTGLIGAIVAEFISSNQGIGYLIVRSSMMFDTASVFAGIIVLAVIVFALNEILARVERHVLRWRPKAE